MLYPSNLNIRFNELNGLLSPSYGNYQFNGNDSFYVGSDYGLLGGDVSSQSSPSVSIGSPTGSAIGDLGFAVSNMSAISPMASAIASAMMDALSPTSVNSVNATNGMDVASDIANAMGLGLSAGVDGVAGIGSNGMGSDVSGESSSSGEGVGATSGDSSSGEGSSSSGDSGSSSGDGSSGGGGGDGSSGDYMGGLIGIPQYISGMVTKRNTFGKNPIGPDDAYRKTQLGEYVIKKSAVQKYGKGLLDLINNEEISRNRLRGIL